MLTDNKLCIMNNFKAAFFTILVVVTQSVFAQNQDTNTYKEQYRLQTHFSPKAHWINDPNGMVYFNHTYHLFFQYYPNGSTWGPMHWGHAISTDLAHWKELPIALYPDSLGYIFSGSAVVDSNNTSGFAKGGKIPLVAIFTAHDPKAEHEGKNNFENQSIAYSLDEGLTWTKFEGNPVLKNLGIRDFRDPNVMWYAPQKKWIMTLATLDRVTFYSSTNLKDWKKESDFGSNLGSHDGVWECPNLFSLQFNKKTYWVLIGNINPGGPNKGSATQYFVGEFNGTNFLQMGDTKTKWIDYGPDDYAGVTWNNTGNRKIFLGWMSNWIYANQLPTEKWRNAMTIPRELSLKNVNGEFYLSSTPVAELNTLDLSPIKIPASKLKTDYLFEGKVQSGFKLKFAINHATDFSIKLYNDEGDNLIIGYDKAKNQYYIDRTHAGISSFNREFAKTVFAPKISNFATSIVEIIFDNSSLEFFGDDGLSIMSALYFPKKPYNHLQFKFNANNLVKQVELVPTKSIW